VVRCSNCKEYPTTQNYQLSQMDPRDALTIAVGSRVNKESMGHGLMSQMSRFLDGSYGSWADTLSPMTNLHIYRKHVVQATFVVGDN